VKTGGASRFGSSNTQNAMGHPDVVSDNLSGGLHRHVKKPLYSGVPSSVRQTKIWALKALGARATGRKQDRFERPTLT
jgi:hypothetical protein